MALEIRDPADDAPPLGYVHHSGGAQSKLQGSQIPPGSRIQPVSPSGGQRFGFTAHLEREERFRENIWRS